MQIDKDSHIIMSCTLSDVLTSTVSGDLFLNYASWHRISASIASDVTSEVTGLCFPTAVVFDMTVIFIFSEPNRCNRVNTQKRISVKP